MSGASTGLGQAFAQMLLAEGVDVWGSARDVARLAHLSTEFSGNATNAGVAPGADTANTAVANLGALEGDYPRGRHGRFTPVALDLADGAEAERIFRETAAQACGGQCENAGGDQCENAGGFDIVINNAGYSVFGDFAATDFAHWQRQIEVMLVNTARLAHAALGDWRAREAAEQGRREVASDALPPRPRALVNVSSLAAEFPLPYQTSYNIVKAGLTALSESLMIETAGTSLSVIDLRPGDYRTDFARSVLYLGEHLEELHFDAGATTPLSKERKADVPPSEARKIERLKTAKAAFERLMQGGPPPEHAARALRRALLRCRSTTLRCGRFSQAVLAPLLARFGSLALKRRVQARYFDV